MPNKGASDGLAEKLAVAMQAEICKLKLTDEVTMYDLTIINLGHCRQAYLKHKWINKKLTHNTMPITRKIKKEISDFKYWFYALGIYATVFSWVFNFLYWASRLLRIK